MDKTKQSTNYILSFSKIITIAWVIIWLETIIFTQVITLFNLGDVNAIEIINNNVIDIGKIICPFYFTTKCVENVAKGVEEHIEHTLQVAAVNEDEDDIEPTNVDNE